MCAAVAAALYLAAWIYGGRELATLRAQRCEPLRIVDRAGRPLRTLAPACGAPRKASWTKLADVPELWLALVVAGEDRRFQQHVGVDPLAIARAVFTNVRAGAIVSGASTLSMQLTALTHERSRRHSLRGKLIQAFRGFALERRASKAEILEAYVNLAYYGAGAYGIAGAAETFFGRPVAALRDGESALLAVLPRAPSAYDPRRHLARALSRRGRLLAHLVETGALSPERKQAIEAEPIAIATQARQRVAHTHADHFVDWVVSGLPAAERRAGGVLTTTLDAELQAALERATREHVAMLEVKHVSDAAVVVLDAQSGAVRAMVGSKDYTHSQLNLTTRRRRLGSLLKPFVYGLAIEAGASSESIALDIGNVSDYRARDWVGREAGPLSYREALAGSYNLAAVNVLARVGVAALHARLRQAGVADLTLPPAHYGLPLALGSARVRLLDVASSYGFLVRGGHVRQAYGVDRLRRGDGSLYKPEAPSERSVFSPEVSYRVLDMLSDAAARHRRFGRGLPLELADDVPIAAKTGTASGMSDTSAVLASREFIVASWTGRLDGRPTHGMSGMWGAAPLARRALELALHGRAPSLPLAPAQLARSNALAAHGGKAALPATDPTAAELEAWAQRARALGPAPVHTRR